jgi:hypothetical protein
VAKPRCETKWCDGGRRPRFAPPSRARRCPIATGQVILASVEVPMCARALGSFEMFTASCFGLRTANSLFLLGRKGVFPIAFMPFLVDGSIDAASVDRMIAGTVESPARSRRRSKRSVGHSLRHSRLSVDAWRHHDAERHPPDHHRQRLLRHVEARGLTGLEKISSPQAIRAGGQAAPRSDSDRQRWPVPRFRDGARSRWRDDRLRLSRRC